MRIYVEYLVSIRCRLGLHDKGDAEHGCQGAFTPLLGNTRFCACKCHEPVAKPWYANLPEGFLEEGDRLAAEAWRSLLGTEEPSETGSGPIVGLPWSPMRQILRPSADACAHGLSRGTWYTIGTDGHFVTNHCRDCENDDRAAWIAEVERHLHVALAQAAKGKTFEWDLPDPDPTAYDWEPPPGHTWSEPFCEGFPSVPGPDATFAQIKRYANVQTYAAFYLEYDENFNVPAEFRLSPAEAWRLAEDNYDRLHPEGTT